ncbi:neuronal acetylcholine receptor subunit alpha-5 [Lates japonicus]|uniref:Neuronal acetylcholine receptor subunit alpha-5 n=1 Tax=Lates japonicus TaxID=270547 RepID=A0AAD3RLA6_LATJO|nr:neuronal acetylcholine receptor subunit alpha-5 [Lates japonicus]
MQARQAGVRKPVNTYRQKQAASVRAWWTTRVAEPAVTAGGREVYGTREAMGGHHPEDFHVDKRFTDANVIWEIVKGHRQSWSEDRRQPSYPTTSTRNFHHPPSGVATVFLLVIEEIIPAILKAIPPHREYSGFTMIFCHTLHHYHRLCHQHPPSPFFYTSRHGTLVRRFSCIDRLNCQWPRDHITAGGPGQGAGRLGMMKDSAPELTSTSTQDVIYKQLGLTCYITMHVVKDNEVREVVQDWKFVAQVLDRVFLWAFLLVSILGSALLFIPVIYKWANIIVPNHAGSIL